MVRLSHPLLVLLFQSEDSRQGVKSISDHPSAFPRAFVIKTTKDEETDKICISLDFGFFLLLVKLRSYYMSSQGKRGFHGSKQEETLPYCSCCENDVQKMMQSTIRSIS